MVCPAGRWGDQGTDPVVASAPKLPVLPVLPNLTVRQKAHVVRKNQVVRKLQIAPVARSYRVTVARFLTNLPRLSQHWYRLYLYHQMRRLIAKHRPLRW